MTMTMMVMVVMDVRDVFFLYIPSYFPFDPLPPSLSLSLSFFGLFSLRFNWNKRHTFTSNFTWNLWSNQWKFFFFVAGEDEEEEKGNQIHLFSSLSLSLLIYDVLYLLFSSSFSSSSSTATKFFFCPLKNWRIFYFILFCCCCCCCRTSFKNVKYFKGKKRHIW